MTRRIITLPAGQSQATISWGGTPGLNWPQTDLITGGQVVDIIPGSAQETAYSGYIANLTATQQADCLAGDDGQATSNGA